MARKSRSRKFNLVGPATAGSVAVRGTTALAIPQRGQGSYKAARTVARRKSNGGKGG